MLKPTCAASRMFCGVGSHTQEGLPWPWAEAMEAYGVFRRIIFLLVLLSGSEQRPKVTPAVPILTSPLRVEIRRIWDPS